MSIKVVSTWRVECDECHRGYVVEDERHLRNALELDHESGRYIFCRDGGHVCDSCFSKERYEKCGHQWWDMLLDAPATDWSTIVVCEWCRMARPESEKCVHESVSSESGCAVCTECGHIMGEVNA